MNSTTKGNIFEDRVFSAIQRELRDDNLGLSPKLSSAFKKKGYYSRDRESDIIFDVSVEVTLPNADKWSILLICECKDYSGSVPVDDVEEFKSKLDQVTGANRKGIMVIRGAMQSSALKYAKANGIGVVRLLDDEQVEYLTYMVTSSTYDAFDRLNPSEFNRALTTPGFIGKNREFYAIGEGYIFGSWSPMLRKMLKT